MSESVVIVGAKRTPVGAFQGQFAGVTAPQLGAVAIKAAVEQAGVKVEEIDEARADAARKRAEEILKKGVPADTDAYLAMEAALRRSNLRLDAVRRYRKGGSQIHISEN